ncbi:MAG TPA: hypothetical protein DCW45_06190, partial [Opitutae bacterium]|nr:hypothetical protein [Opitutae bacterium]
MRKARKSPQLKNIIRHPSLFLTLLGCLGLVPLHQNLHATVEGGALVKGSTFSDNTTTIPEENSDSKAIKWSNADLDPSIFEFDASNPTRLKIKVAGDYFLAFTGPIMEATRTADKRSQVYFSVKKNGSTPIETGIGRSTYIRHSSDHTESSGHIHILLSSLSADDYIEIFSKAIDNSTDNSVKIGTA